MVCLLLLVALTATALFGNPETTVPLPGGGSMEFVWIEPGTFTMGSSDRYAFANEKPAHQVTLTHGFWLSKYELTQGQWEAVMRTTPWVGWPYVVADSARPAVYIGWGDSQAWCAQLTAAGDGALYRLPTEAEWEYACRAGTTTPWSSGADTTGLAAHEWFLDNAWNQGIRQGQPVGQLLPNAWGLYDMQGNVSEWVQDWYAEYPAAAQVDPLGPATGARWVFRGTCFRGNDRYARCANRFWTDEASFPTYWVGLRVLREGVAPGTAVTPASWGTVKQEAGGRWD